MCRSPAVQASGDGERRLLRPANWNYRPEADIAGRQKQTVRDRYIASQGNALVLPVVGIVELLYARRTAFEDMKSLSRQGVAQPTFWH